MGRLKIEEVLSYSEFAMAKYHSDSGDHYEIVFSRNFTSKKGGEHFELVCVEQDGEVLAANHPVQIEIHTHLVQSGHQDGIAA